MKAGKCDSVKNIFHEDFEVFSRKDLFNKAFHNNQRTYFTEALKNPKTQKLYN